MINKELLSKVLDNEVPYQVKVHKIIIKNNSLNYFYNSKDSGGGLFEANEYINIYELAHKCKEWALSKGYIINSGATTSNDWSSTIYKVIKENPYTKELSHTWGQSENEAIFRACQWILNKDSKWH